MTYLCVAIFVQSEQQAQRDIALAAEAGADMVELRIDDHADLGAIGLGQLSLLLQSSSLPAIVTCRPIWEGGRSRLSDTDRLALLSAADEADAAYLDVELETTRHAEAKDFLDDKLPRRREERAGLIFSSHDFTGRPAKLTAIFDELVRSPADVAKIVWTARTVRDNLEAFELLRHRAKPTIALCMGEAGLISRVLAKKFGAFLTFASLETGGGTAPGQVSVRDMKRLYRWDAIAPATKVYGVVGSPVAHSMSPAIHNAAFDTTGFDGVYVPLLVEPSYESFKAFMETFLAAEGLHLSGLSVTIPHKENALRYLKEKGAEIDPLAERIGALNTIAIRRVRLGGRGGNGVEESNAEPSNAVASAKADPTLYGTSTDYAAILDSITTKLGISREQLKDYRVAVIGAGGTGRTAVAALAHYGATVVVYNRTREKADALAAEFNGKTGKVVAADMAKLCDSCCQIYINTTSIGMSPNVEQSAFGDRPPALSADSVVFDAVYNPVRTMFIRQAEAAGARTINGVEMFVRQAAAQFELWTGTPAPTDVMRNVVESRL
ncbi:type I 3-dehydroquinate dehydratase [Humisphaera borealis]|uniref:Multifunctional fusion protein n=1 Tax=Humisphaera borealis TaxID=2807512 RepID=A0A7M2X0F6_9BACT|nr:type I 3-dehydroquinate dehydratase [Humisphaera borealis]QOV91129.1 type I 3-dehydroquinate dehydratase [Humisphaera borealis]